MNAHSITTIIVDVGGVLHESDRGFIDDLRTELNLSNDQFARVLKILFDQLGRGTISEEKFWETLASDFGVRQITNDEKLLSRALSKNFSPHRKFLQYIHDLKKRGLRIVVFSNTIEPHVTALREAGIYKGFDREFLSNEIGYRKPDHDAFRYVLGELDITPDAALFVDDDIKNTSAAKDLGMYVVHFTDESTAIQEIEHQLTI